MMPSRPLAVFDADAPPALAFVRSLGRAGVPIHVYTHTRMPPARFSRYTRRVRLAPNPDHLDAFVPWLRAAILSGEIGLVAPTSDTIVYALSQALDDDRFEAFGLAPREALLDAVFKDRFAAACERHALPTPASQAPTSPGEALAVAAQLRFPIILKPRSHVATGADRGCIVTSPETLPSAFAPLNVPDGRNLVRERHPHAAWPLLQEVVPHSLSAMFSVSGVLGRDGAPLALAASRKLYQWPTHLGIGTAFEPCHDPEVFDAGLRVAQRMLGRGLFEVELIRDPRNNELVTVDLNPRGYGQMRYEMVRGFDLPRLWYETAHGWDPAPLGRAPESDVLCVHHVPFHLGRWMGVLRGPGRRRHLAEYGRLLRRRAVGLVFDRGDVVSSTLYAAQMLGHSPLILRSFLGRAALSK